MFQTCEQFHTLRPEHAGFWRMEKRLLHSAKVWSCISCRLLVHLSHIDVLLLLIQYVSQILGPVNNFHGREAKRSQIRIKIKELRLLGD